MRHHIAFQMHSTWNVGLGNNLQADGGAGTASVAQVQEALADVLRELRADNSGAMPADVQPLMARASHKASKLAAAIVAGPAARKKLA